VATKLVLCRYSTDLSHPGVTEGHVINGPEVAVLEHAALQLSPSRPSATLGPCFTDVAKPLWVASFSDTHRVVAVSSRGDCVTNGVLIVDGNPTWQQAVTLAAKT